MDYVKEFLDTSTIHGLSRISSTRRLLRLFWILIVIGGFSGAGYLIYKSFETWQQSPITTTIEALPISQIRFPNVTVCPPKNSFLNLNYDIQQSENVGLENNTRKELLDFALDVIQGEFYKVMMRNLSKVEDPDRYYNWYHGYTRIVYPYFKDEQLYYNVFTSAKSGNISTKYFGDKFDNIKVENNIMIRINLEVPQSVKGYHNTTLMFGINKKTMNEVSDYDKLCMYPVDKCFDADQTYWSKNITPDPGKTYQLELNRQVSADDISNMDLDMMPGFRYTWRYNNHVEAETLHSNRGNKGTTKQFVR